MKGRFDNIALTNQIDKLGLQKQVHLLASRRCSRSHKCDGPFPLNFSWRRLPNVSEAMACGVLPISYDVGDVRDYPIPELICHSDRNRMFLAASKLLSLTRKKRVFI